MALVEGGRVGVGEEGLRQLSQEGLDQRRNVVGRGVAEGGVGGGGAAVEVCVQCAPQLLRLRPEGRPRTGMSVSWG